jgi:hypothetical protein
LKITEEVKMLYLSVLLVLVALLITLIYLKLSKKVTPDDASLHDRDTAEHPKLSRKATQIPGTMIELIESRFSALKRLGKFMAGLGWVAMGLSIVAGFVAIWDSGGVGATIGILIMIGGTLSGIVTVAMGQTVQCLVAIEYNTRLVASKPMPGRD